MRLVFVADDQVYLLLLNSDRDIVIVIVFHTPGVSLMIKLGFWGSKHVEIHCGCSEEWKIGGRLK